MQQLTQLALPVYHKQIMSTSSCISFIFLFRGKYLVINAKYFLFRAKWIGDKSLRKLLLTVECKNEQLTFLNIRRHLSMFYSPDFSLGREFYCGDIVTWLILPVVMCLSQRLSHACLSISNCTVKLRMAH